MSKRLSILFLNSRNRDFCKKNYHLTAFLNGHLNVAIVYFGFFASQNIEDEYNSLECAWDLAKLLESEKI